jgi:hypothetical protein
MKALLVGITLVALANSILYNTTIVQSSVYCFSELIRTYRGDSARNTPFHFRTTSTRVNSYTIKLVLQNGTILTKREHPSLTKKIDSYSAASMEYHFCIENHEMTDDFEVSFHQGLEVRI